MIVIMKEVRVHGDVHLHDHERAVAHPALRKDRAYD
jgi:hypothetical protein